MIAIVGPNAKKYAAPNTYAELLNGYHYRYFMPKKANVAWVDLASGDYEGTMKAKLVAVSNADDAQLVYTTDGTEPTASSKKAKSGEELEIPFGETTLKVGLLMNGAVSGILTRNYKVEKPAAFDLFGRTAG